MEVVCERVECVCVCDVRVKELCVRELRVKELCVCERVLCDPSCA